MMQTDHAHVEIVFGINEPNPGWSTQVDLLEEAVLTSGVDRGTFLDFGVGGNMSAFQKASSLMPQHRFMGCDVYKAETDGYFETYRSTAAFGQFEPLGLTRPRPRRCAR